MSDTRSISASANAAASASRSPLASTSAATRPAVDDCCDGAAGSLPDGLLVSWYGDDYTGSAAVMEVLSFAGLPSVLFFDVPTAAQIASVGPVRGLGIAGTARSQSPAWMSQNLPNVYGFLASLKTPITHLKVCSTLDSSPEVGSIGRAIELAEMTLPSAWVPLLLAAPAMRRYQAFGHLFAAAAGGVFRLDRHPVMSRHPVTPMNESDVIAHLGKQTSLGLGRIDLEQLRSDRSADAALAAGLAAGARVFAVDCVDDRSLAAAGRVIWQNRGPHLFAVGSQGLEYALVRHWIDAGLIPASPEPAGAEPAERIAVVSGSVSPTTAAQIGWAIDHGFQAIEFDARSVVADESKRNRAIDAAAADACRAVDAGSDPLVHTARGPDDPRAALFRAAVAEAGIDPDHANRLVGQSLGIILDRILRTTGVKRAVICGGDTSGHAASQLGIYALKALAPTAPGGAICTAISEDPAIDGLQIALKGGQMGQDDYLGWVKQGGGPPVA